MIGPKFRSQVVFLLIAFVNNVRNLLTAQGGHKKKVMNYDEIPMHNLVAAVLQMQWQAYCVCDERQVFRKKYMPCNYQSVT